MKLDLFRRDGRPSRRRRLAVVVTALAAVAIALTPAGSASPPSSGIKQYTVCLAQSATPGTCDTSALPGGSVVSLTLTITNANSSTQSLGSANVDGPVGSNGQPVFPINLDPAKGPLPTFVSGTGTFGTNTSGELQLRNLTVAPGSSPLRVSFSVVTSCTGGSGTWKAPAKQSNNFLGNGNDFALVQSGGLTSSVGSGSCKLVWLYPPNHANKNATITNTAYTPTVGGNVHNVAVEAVAADGVTPLDLNSGTATLSPTGGTFDCGFVVWELQRADVDDVPARRRDIPDPHERVHGQRLHTASKRDGAAADAEQRSAVQHLDRRKALRPGCVVFVLERAARRQD